MPCPPSESSLGVLAQLGFAETNPGSPPANPTEALEFDSESFALVDSFQDTSGIRGTRATPASRVAAISSAVTGGFVCRPTPDDVYLWLPRIMGGTYAGTGLETIKMAEHLPCFDAFKRLVLPSATQGFKYRACKVQTATFSAAERGNLSLSVEAVGRSRDAIASPYSWPSGVNITPGNPWVFANLTLTVGGTNYRVMNCQIAFDNMFEPRYGNSLTITDMPSSGRRITMGFNFAYGLASALRASFLTAQAVTARFEYGTSPDEKVLEFVCAKARPMDLRDPGVPGKGEILWDIALDCLYDTDPTEQMVVNINK